MGNRCWRAPRVVYFLHANGLCGGIRVIFEQVSRLNANGIPAAVWATAPPQQWFKARPLPWRAFANSSDLIAAARNDLPVGVWKVATWWETAAWVQAALGSGDRGGYLVQDDERSYTTDETTADRVLATYRLGLTHFTLGDWVTNWLRDEMGQQPVQVGMGIDHDVFWPLGIPRDRNRIFTPYRPFAGPNDLKGWRVASATLAELRRLNPDASVVTFGIGGSPPAGDIPRGMAHIHVTNETDSKLAELYAQTGVYLQASRHEGFGLCALEAMACACPVVTTDAHGNREYSRHEDTVLLGDCPLILARHIYRLQTDTEFADAVATRGRAEAVKYQWAAVIDKLRSEFR